MTAEFARQEAAPPKPEVTNGSRGSAPLTPESRAEASGSSSPSEIEEFGEGLHLETEQEREIAQSREDSRSPPGPRVPEGAEGEPPAAEQLRRGGRRPETESADSTEKPPRARKRRRGRRGRRDRSGSASAATRPQTRAGGSDESGAATGGPPPDEPVASAPESLEGDPPSRADRLPPAGEDESTAAPAFEETADSSRAARPLRAKKTSRIRPSTRIRRRRLSRAGGTSEEWAGAETSVAEPEATSSTDRDAPSTSSQRSGTAPEADRRVEREAPASPARPSTSPRSKPAEGKEGAASRPRLRSRRAKETGRKSDPGEGRKSSPAVRRRILVNATDEEEVRIAVVENGQLDQLHYEWTAEKKYLGNIYKGRIVNLEPAIQAAFIDIGIGRNGFLHVSDVLPAYRDATSIPVDRLSRRIDNWKRLKIQDILRNGQEVLVQISKDSIGAKGPSLTTYISVPGKFLVLMPGVSRYGVSKRIRDGEERAQLREKLANLHPPEGIGYIVRTAGQEESQEALARDFDHLMGVWKEICRAVREERAPCMIYAESDLIIRAMRDLFGVDVDEILIDEKGVYDRARHFLLDVMPQAAKKLKSYNGQTPLFTKFGVEEEIEKIYNRRVPLPSGGHLVIEQTEALVAIDVNSGKYRDEVDLEATALKTNLEAAEEVSRQLRLRDLGGVIILDFIDMEVASHRREVEKALRSALKNDRAKSWFTRISRFGIVEMTRQRVRPSFEKVHHEVCKHCGGTGTVKAPRATGITIMRQLRTALGSKRRQGCEVLAHPDVVRYLVNERRRHLLEIETEYNKTINIRAEENFSPEQFIVRFH